MKKQETSLVLVVLALLITTISTAQTTYPETIEKGEGYVLTSGTQETLIATKSIKFTDGVWIQSGATIQAKIKEGSYISIHLDQNENYVYTRSYQNPLKSFDEVSKNEDVIEQVTYVDGLGRPKQQNNIKQGPDHEDIITYIEYDEFGRQAKSYLPYARTTNEKGSYNPHVKQHTLEYYHDHFPTEVNPSYPNPYTENQYDNSPLNRVLKQGAPGLTWELGQGHEIEYEQDVNTMNEVYQLQVVKNTEGVPVLTIPTETYYPAGSLYKITIKDENHTGTTKNHTTEEFKNQLGQVILKRTYSDTSTATEVAHDTYYVYDEYGNLAIVLPPLTNIEEIIDITVEPELIPKYESQGVQYSKELDLKEIAGPDSGGYIKIKIIYDQIVVNIGGGTNSEESATVLSELEVPIETNCPLPDMFLGYLKVSYNESGSEEIIDTESYSAKLEGGNFKIIKHNDFVATGVHFNISAPIDLLTCQIGEIKTYPVNQQILDDLAYQYTYDNQNRIIEKKIPGKGIEYIVYDKLDRPVLTQDSEQRTTNKWQYVKYDVYSRPIETGVYTDNVTVTETTTKREIIQTQLESQTIISGANSFPTSNTEPQSYTYYDQYGFASTGISVPASVYNEPIVDNSKGLVTGSKTKVLETNNWITTVNYYDKYGRVIYNYSVNEFLQTVDKTQIQYDFVGKIKQSQTTHDKLGQAQVQIADTYTYDHAGRLLTQEQQLNNQPQKELIVSNTYNKLGQLENKQVGNTKSSPLQKVDYQYNIRGWLTHINNPEAPTAGDLFNFEIKYDKPTAGATPLFNGNISQTHWRTDNQDKSKRHYNYSYDDLNRLTKADYKVDGTTFFDKNYKEHLQYDKNGNITSLYRTGDVIQDGNLEWMDVMSYQYQGNQLQRIAETGHGNFGFKTSIASTNTQVQYEYDSNGNMTKDRNKKIDHIGYNHLNLPTTIIFSEGGVITYTYDALGVKQQKQVSQNGQVTTTYYAGAFTYKKLPSLPETLEYITQPEGYITRENNQFYYTYQYKDHLGNIRLSYQDSNGNGEIVSSEIVEENNYYPYGLKHKGYNNVVTGKKHPFGFGGKEFQDELNLEWYDVSARNYDPVIGRWMNIDPLAETMRRHSPYNFAFNNPVYFQDYDGLSPTGNNEDKNNKKPHRTIKNTFKYDENVNGGNTGSGTDSISELVVINTSKKNDKGQSVYTTQSVRTTMTVNSKGEISENASTEILTTTIVMTKNGPKAKVERVNGVMKSNLASKELTNATLDVQQKKLNNENTLSPVQVAANNINIGLNFSLAVGSGGFGGYYLAGAKASAVFSAAMFVGTEVSDFSNILSPENIYISYDLD